VIVYHSLRAVCSHDQ